MSRVKLRRHIAKHRCLRLSRVRLWKQPSCSQKCVNCIKYSPRRMSRRNTTLQQMLAIRQRAPVYLKQQTVNERWILTEARSQSVSTGKSSPVFMKLFTYENVSDIDVCSFRLLLIIKQLQYAAANSLPSIFLLSFCLTDSLHHFANYCLNDTQGGITKNSTQTLEWPKPSSLLLL